MTAAAYLARYAWAPGELILRPAGEHHHAKGAAAAEVKSAHNAFIASRLKRAETWESTVTLQLQHFFDRQKRVVLEKLGGRKSRERWERGQTKDVDPGSVFDASVWGAQLRTDAEQWIRAIFADFGAEQALQFGISFSLADPRVTDAINAQVNRIVGINDTTYQAIQGALAAGEQAGETITELADRVGTVFEAARGQRAELIARTEVMGALNSSSVLAARQAGMGQKTWWTAEDERVCPECDGVDGVTVGIDEDFPDVGGDPPAHPDCRCTVTFAPGDASDFEDAETAGAAPQQVKDGHWVEIDGHAVFLDGGADDAGGRGGGAAPEPPRQDPVKLPPPGEEMSKPDIKKVQFADLRAARAEMRANARVTEADARGQLEAMDAEKMAKPPADWKKNGDWDWFGSLNPAEQSRLRSNWMSADATQGPDNIAERVHDYKGGDTASGTSMDGHLQTWVDLTRQADAAKAIASGEAPAPGRYGGMNMQGLVGDSPYDPAKAFNRDIEMSANHVAAVNENMAATYAARALPKVPATAVAPWQMTSAAYVSEMTQLEATDLTPVSTDPEFGPQYSAAQQAAIDRYNQLFSRDLWESLPAGSTLSDLHDAMTEQARMAGLIP